MRHIWVIEILVDGNWLCFTANCHNTRQEARDYRKEYLYSDSSRIRKYVPEGK